MTLQYPSWVSLVIVSVSLRFEGGVGGWQSKVGGGRESPESPSFFRPGSGIPVEYYRKTRYKHSEVQGHTLTTVHPLLKMEEDRGEHHPPHEEDDAPTTPTGRRGGSLLW